MCLHARKLNAMSIFTRARVYRALALSLCSVAAACASADTLSRIRERGEFRLGHRQSSMPFSYIDATGAPVGYSLDICQKIFERVKTELKLPALKLKYVLVQPSDRIQAVKESRIDVECGSTTHTAARAKDVDFSYSIFFAGARFAAKKEANLREWQDLRGKTIAVTEKTTTETALGTMNKDRNMNLKLVLVKDHAEGFRRMQAGETDAVANDDAMLYGLINAASKPKDFDFVGKHISVEPYGIMYAKGDAPMNALVDATILSLFKSGEIRQIHAKWFERGGYTLPMSLYMRENVNIPGRFAIQ